MPPSLWLGMGDSRFWHMVWCKRGWNHGPFVVKSWAWLVRPTRYLVGSILISGPGFLRVLCLVMCSAGIFVGSKGTLLGVRAKALLALTLGGPCRWFTLQVGFWVACISVFVKCLYDTQTDFAVGPRSACQGCVYFCVASQARTVRSLQGCPSCRCWGSCFAIRCLCWRLCSATVQCATWALQENSLASWLCELSWFPSADGCPHSDVSWLEIFWGFIHDTACLPPFRAGSAWVSVDDDVSFGLVLPSVKVLFCTCHLALLLGLPRARWFDRPLGGSSVHSIGCRTWGTFCLSRYFWSPCPPPRGSCWPVSSVCLADLRIPSFH